MENLVSMSDFDQSFQKETVCYFGANVTVLSRAVAFQKILAFPSIVFDFDGRHSIEPLFNLVFLPNRLKALVTSRETRK